MDLDFFSHAELKIKSPLKDHTVNGIPYSQRTDIGVL
jgi:hypothetical protein